MSVSGKVFLIAVIVMSAIAIWSPAFTSDVFAHTGEDDGDYDQFYHSCEGPCNPQNCHHGWALEGMDSKMLVKSLKIMQRIMHLQETMGLTDEEEGPVNDFGE